MLQEFQNLEIASHTVEPFVLCLASGVLQAVKSDVWSLDAGTWTIRRPLFFENLVQLGVLREVVEQLDKLDELPALAKLAGKEAAMAEIEMIEAVIKRRLKHYSEDFWLAQWKGKDLERDEFAERTAY